MRGHGTALAHLLFLAARRRPHEFGLHGCLLRSHPLTLPTAPISFNFLAVNDIVAAPLPEQEAHRKSSALFFHCAGVAPVKYGITCSPNSLMAFIVFSWGMGQNCSMARNVSSCAASCKYL